MKLYDFKRKIGKNAINGLFGGFIYIFIALRGFLTPWLTKNNDLWCDRSR